MSNRKSAKGKDGVFTKEERAAIQEYVREKTGKNRGGKEDGEAQVRAAIAKMKGADRAMAEKIHTIIKSNAPDLSPKTWYGMPAYAKEDKVICFFQPGQKFKTRYSTFGFSDKAKLDEGSMWPNSYALLELTPSVEAKIIQLVKRAVS